MITESRRISTLKSKLRRRFLEGVRLLRTTRGTAPSGRVGFLVLSLLVILLAGCGDISPTPTISSVTSTISPPTQTSTPQQPSPTPQPLAALVNGEGIGLGEYQAELARYQAAVGRELSTEDELKVLNDLIERVLLAQAAVEAGYLLDEGSVQARYDQLVTQLGDEGALLAWMSANGYSESDFRHDLARSIAGAWMRDKILSELPGTIEQVHARQILLYNLDEANEIYTQLGAGEDFAALAAQYDPVAKGDLGWVPRGYLLNPKLEEVAFGLHPGEYSQVVETEIGFHILQVIERDSQKPLVPDARLVLQQMALQNWMETRRAQSDIEVLIP
jgi:peptidyl-prolyl cis-trans isomerase C